jgi:hypothetical protein
MKHVMPALAVARQVDLDANERIRIVKHVERQAHDCRAFPRRPRLCAPR